MSEQEMIDRINAATAKAEKNKQEVIGVVAELKTALENQGTISPAVAEALDRLDGVLSATDDVVEDEVTGDGSDQPGSGL